jgi:hypothetical protein
VSGFTGASGLSGLTGASGVSGLTGASGVSGLTGASGVSGLTGASGVSGLTGASGLSGLTGASGVSGLTGASGLIAGSATEILFNFNTTSASGSAALTISYGLGGSVVTMSSLLVSNASKFGGNIDISQKSIINISSLAFGVGSQGGYGNITLSGTSNILITPSGFDQVTTAPYSSTRNVYVFGNLLPGATNTYNLGQGGANPSLGWSQVFASNITIAPTTLTLRDGITPDVRISAEGGVISANVSGKLGSALPGAMTNQNLIFACVLDDNSNILGVSPNGLAWCNVLTPSAAIGLISQIAFDGTATWVGVGGFAGHGSIIACAGPFADSGWTEVGDYLSVAADFGAQNAVCYCGKNNRWYSMPAGAIENKRSIIRSLEKDEQVWESAVDISAGSQYFKGLSGAPLNYGIGYTIAWDGNDTLVAGGFYGDIDQFGNPVAPNSSVLYAIPSQSGNIWYNATTEDGVTLLTGAAQSAVFNGAQWAICSGGTIFVSDDGRKWKQTLYMQPAVIDGIDRYPQINALQWNGQQWLAFGNESTTFHSFDGYVWTPGVNVGGQPPFAVGWNGTYWFLGGQSFAEGGGVGTLLYSSSVAGPWDASTKTALGDPNNPNQVPILDTGVVGFANRALLPNCPITSSVNLFNQSGPPSLDLGNVGDYYIDSSTGWAYGPKTADYEFGSGGSVFLIPTTTISTMSGSEVFNVGLSDFTVNFFMYPTILPSLDTILPASLIRLENISGTGLGAIGVSISADTGLYVQIDASYYSADISAVANVWQYCTLRQAGGNIEFYVDGVQKLTTTVGGSPIGNNVNPLVLGGNYTGLMTNIRWTSSLASFAVPDVPLTALPETNLLLLTTSAGSMFTDSTGTFTDVSALVYNSCNVFMGANPFAGLVTLSWGAPTIPASSTKTVRGYGVPADGSNPEGTNPGDTYIDLNTMATYLVT